MCAKMTYSAARQAVSDAGGISNIILRLIQIPKRGGILTLFYTYTYKYGYNIAVYYQKG